MQYYNSVIFILLLSLPPLMLTVHHAASTLFFLLLLTTLISIPFHRKINWNQLPFPWWLLASFLFYPLLVIIHSLGFGIYDKHSLEIALRFLVLVLCLIYRPYFKSHWQPWLYIAAALGAVLSLLSALTMLRFDLTQRAMTYFTGPTNFGDLIVLIGILSLGNLFQNTKKLTFSIGCMGLIATIFGAYLSQTRASWIVVLAVFMIWLIQSNQFKKITKLILLSLVILALTFIYNKNSIVNHRVNQTKTELKAPVEKDPSSSIALRKQFLKSSWLIIQEHPWLGIGGGQYPKVLETQVHQGLALQNLTKEYYQHPHNEVIFAWVQFGILGALSVLAFYLGPLVFFYQQLKKKQTSIRIASKLGMLMIISYMIFGFVDVMITAWVMESSIFVMMLLIPIYIITSSSKT